jgi:hypothetical protein
MNPEKNVIEYLESRGASFSGERVGKAGMLVFSIPGESRENGRVLVKRDGSVSVWHIGANKGLNLGQPWRPGEKKLIGTREVASVTISANELSRLPHTSIPLVKLQQQRLTYDHKAFEAAVNHALTSQGWKFAYARGGIQHWNDGTGSTPSERVKIGDGIATAWSFRNDVSLPAPWQKGRDTQYGSKAMFVTARDLSLESNGLSTVPSATAQLPQRQPVNQETVELVRQSWANGVFAPSEHPQLNKAGAQLNPTMLRVFPASFETMQKHLTGDLIAPLFRDDGKGGLELTGAQRLMSAPYNGNDKMILSGTQTAGAFMPVPPTSLMSPIPKIEAWIQQLGPDAKEKPLVIAEGVATGLAIHQAGAGNVLVAVSSGNLPAVAQWVKDSGLNKHFPAGVVIAADLDSSRDANGKLKSNAIPKAMQAAEIVGGKVALASAGLSVGTDARDLLGSGGPDAVQTYIKNAVTPEYIRHRRDVFPEQRPSHDMGQDLGR